MNCMSSQWFFLAQRAKFLIAQPSRNTLAVKGVAAFERHRIGGK